MGRTKRRRSQKFVKVNACENQNNSNELLPLQKYLGTNFRWKNESKLICRYFDETERGICSKQRQKSNILIQLPIKSLITFKTILEDIAFIDSFKNNVSNEKIKFQMLLAIYLLYNRNLDSSIYKPYLNSLPKTVSHPYFCERRELYFLPFPILQEIVEIKKTIKTFFDMYEHLFGSNVCLQDLEWAYFIVQTRSVFVPEQKYTSAELELLVDEPQFGLAPFLDMFNHSSTAKNKLEILDNKYTLFSENNFKKYEEIFISYGILNNSKLMINYGFFSSQNDDDYFEIYLRDVEELLQDNKHLHKIQFPHINNSKFKFIRSHNLDTSLYFDHKEGISYNLSIILFLIFRAPSDFANVLSQIAYGSNCTEITASTKNEAKLLLDLKIKEYKQYEHNLKNFKNISLNAKNMLSYLHYCICYLEKCSNKIEN